MARKTRTWLGRFTVWILSRLFCRRNIIIISEHKTGHYPIGVGKQVIVVALVLGFVTWASYSTGSYMAAKDTIAAKDRAIANSSLRNQQIESEFTLLKRDLVKMMNDNSDNLSDYAKFVIEQYGAEKGDSLIELAESDALNSGAILERVAFLEEQMENMAQNYETLISEIEATTNGKVAELERVIRTTRLNLPTMERKAEQALAANREEEDEDNPSGGPYDPVEKGLLATSHENLYKELKRMMVLHEVVDRLPLAEPMPNARQPSRYGMRLDPFTKRLARHGGIDFAGHHKEAVQAANNGTVIYAGRRGAYGNLVEIDHGYGITTRYGHMHSVKVKKGQIVKKGDIIGTQGTTGRSTGSHLHYEVRYNNKTLNPSNFLKAGEYVQQQ